MSNSYLSLLGEAPWPSWPGFLRMHWKLFRTCFSRWCPMSWRKNMQKRTEIWIPHPALLKRAQVGGTYSIHGLKNIIPGNHGLFHIILDRFFQQMFKPIQRPVKNPFSQPCCPPPWYLHGPCLQYSDEYCHQDHHGWLMLIVDPIISQSHEIPCGSLKNHLKSH